MAYLTQVINRKVPAGERRCEGTPMLGVVEDAAAGGELTAGLDELVREGSPADAGLGVGGRG